MSQEKMIINAEDLIVGRFATIAAKEALLGEEVIIVNSEKAIIVGNKKRIFEKYKAQDDRGEPSHGPFLPKTPHGFLKRIIRGMLNYKKGNSRKAFKMIKCYKGVPQEFEGKAITIEKANISRIQHLKYVTIEEICNKLKQR